MLNHKEYEEAKKRLNELTDISVDDPLADEWGHLKDKITQYENEILTKIDI